MTAVKSNDISIVKTVLNMCDINSFPFDRAASIINMIKSTDSIEIKQLIMSSINNINIRKFINNYFNEDI